MRFMPHSATVHGVGVTVGEEGMGAPAVLLEARDEILPIFIGAGQAQSIEQARQDIPPERPMTHDLLIEMFTEVGGAIDQVRIDDLADNTFYAKVDAELFRDGERQKYVFDARPSDGIALAVRVGCPIEITDDVLDVAARPAEEFLEGPEDDMEFRDFEDS
jgi:bifunctional DNase/RNase